MEDLEGVAEELFVEVVKRAFELDNAMHFFSKVDKIFWGVVLVGNGEECGKGGQEPRSDAILAAKLELGAEREVANLLKSEDGVGLGFFHAVLVADVQKVTPLFSRVWRAGKRESIVVGS